MEQWEQKARAVLNVLHKDWKYMAMDSSGVWCVYEYIPHKKEKIWGTTEEYETISDHLFDLDPAPSWKDSLLERSE